MSVIYVQNIILVLTKKFVSILKYNTVYSYIVNVEFITWILFIFAYN